MQTKLHRLNCDEKISSNGDTYKARQPNSLAKQKNANLTIKLLFKNLIAR
jgi:hypothetical protein